MRFLKIVFLVFTILFTSCAERYSTRKRTARVEGGEVVSDSKQVTSIAETSHSKNQKRIKKDEKQTVTDVEITKEEDAVARRTTKIGITNDQQRIVMDEALSYLGSPYKYGGITRSGFDCSGFVSAAFKPLDISLHRSSHEMAHQGKNVDLKNVQIGDLLFFVTGRNKRISHVGIVIEIGSEIKFIHSSTSRGVIISSLSEGYWSKAYRKARRVM